MDKRKTIFTAVVIGAGIMAIIDRIDFFLGFHLWKIVLLKRALII